MNGEFRNFLQDELIERCQKNSKYSIRAFALKLGVESSSLSQILSGKRMISNAMVKRLAEKLDVSPDEVESFQKSNAKVKTSPLQPKHMENLQRVALDEFRAIADWYHYALLELTHLKDFEPDLKWVARALGIRVAEARVAMERLERLGYLEIKERTWVDNTDNLTNREDRFSDIAFRRLQHQVLEMALVALEEVPLEKRNHSSMTFSIDSKLLPLAKKKIQEFSWALCECLQASSQRDEVYQLGISFYPLTKSRSKGGRK